ncbi:AarF/ABC1/UbiB kinase family protein [Janibacter cremeus]|uniref:ABC1 kinase family protein n=1 Tax=Janibacter cremeus TaxID=1285192 RepID=UPI0023F74B00|nr:AarF/ABC1/UbiB kinase family protein [Janibacter cremeus]WEV78157.1 AarF/ABC1/UbiB kinase family protein [Janibacter cremeus]WEV78237.1 AarF/ABC1/UbiB kinase family protein [Janibacter cremeus]
MSEIPRGAAGRAARLASLPLGHAGRSARGLGRRLSGTPAEVVNEDIQRRTAEQLFAVLGSLKGGAMKVGQALSVLEAALPEEYVEPYREMLVRLQDAAPPMSTAEVHSVLTRDLGPDWREDLELEDGPVAAASIGQVHRGVTSDGRVVAVKVQYPGADRALRSDLQQIARLARVATTWMPAMDIKPVTDELLAAADEELDYGLEAANQRAFAQAYRDDPDVAVPDVVRQSRHVLISEWLEGAPLSQIIREADQDVRDRVGQLYLDFLLSGPERVGLLHSDPHPGNFRLTPDGRLGVIDYGAVTRLSEGFPPLIGTLVRKALAGDAEAVIEGLRAEGFIRPGIEVDAQDVLAYLLPLIEPLSTPTHSFTREWLRSATKGLTDLRTPEFSTGLRLNMPREYAMIHRVFVGSTGVLAQLGATIAARGSMQRYLPGFAEE